jgi:RNA polymerase sigma-70 factor (ECF subfamily)
MRSFEGLCEENYGRIYKYIFAMTGSREAAEDLLQDVFTAALRKGDGFLQHENPPAFLYKTARNLTLTYLKKNRRFPTGYLDENIPAGEADLCEAILRDRDRRIDESVYAGQVIGRLDPEQRRLYALRYVDRRPIRDIAAGQGVSEPAMRMRLVRLRREIQDIVRDLRLDEK